MGIVFEGGMIKSINQKTDSAASGAVAVLEKVANPLGIKSDSATPCPQSTSLFPVEKFLKGASIALDKDGNAVLRRQN